MKPMRKQPSHCRIDPFMQDVPYEIYRDEQGKNIGELFTLPKAQLRDGLVNKQKKKFSPK